MSTKPPVSINDANLSHAWGRAFLMAVARAKNDLSPLVVSVAGFTEGAPIEDPCIRRALDATLAAHGKFRSDVSAMVIFPFKIWNLKGRPHIAEFTKFYLEEYLPRLKARNRMNSRGTYFERMIAFQGATRKELGLLHEPKNQLRHIIELWTKSRGGARPRQSALQLACFDPIKDHNGSRRCGFPCLQQISFAYDDTGGLALNAYYPKQYVFDRGYGNYLGLCHLGFFVAHELGLELRRLNCFIACPELGDIAKNALGELRELVSGLIPTAGE